MLESRKPEEIASLKATRERLERYKSLVSQEEWAELEAIMLKDFEGGDNDN